MMKTTQNEYRQKISCVLFLGENFGNSTIDTKWKSLNLKILSETQTMKHSRR